MNADLVPRQADQVLVRTLYSAISRGTESLVFRGEVPSSQYAEMRAPFQEGEFPAPIKYGYTNVGTVQRGRIDETIWPADRVLSLPPPGPLLRPGPRR